MINKWKKLQFVMMATVIVLIVSLGLLIYNSRLRTNLSQLNYQTLEEIMYQQQYNFTSKLKNEKNIMHAFADVFSEFALDDEKILSTLNSILNSSNFENMSISTPDGKTLFNTGEQINMSDQEFFTRALSGKTVISDPIISKANNANVIIISTPITKDKKIIGVLSGSYRFEKLNDVFLPSFNGDGYTYVITNEGDIITKTPNPYLLANSNNLFEFYSKANFYEGDDYETIKKNIVEKKSGYAKYDYQGEKRLVSYATTGINDWSIFSIVPEITIEETANKILKSTLVLTFTVAVMFLLLILYLYYSQKKYFKSLMDLTFKDELTGASNFNKFKMDAAKLIKSDRRYLIMKLDVEKFKLLNELYNFEIGDKILKVMADAMKTSLDEYLDTFARINSDEFVLLINFRDSKDLHAKMLIFQKELKKQIDDLIDDTIVIPIGRYELQEGETDFVKIFEKVNFAHRMAKQSEDKIVDYDDSIKVFAIVEKEIENKMHEALSKNEFKLFLQAKYQLSNEKIVGAEALVRWKSDGVDLVYPATFIPLFEKNGFIKKLDMYMFNKTCELLKNWIDTGIAPMTISVNFSRLHLKNKNFVDELSKIADRHQVPHHFLEIELTETVMFDNADILEQVLENLHHANFTLSMDDFGTGYSSLGLLKNLPVDVIKIDRCFFTHPKDELRAKTVIASVMNMAKKLNIKTVAEGVETKENIDLLRELGCDIVQGYYYAKPMSIDAFEKKYKNS